MTATSSEAAKAVMGILKEGGYGGSGEGLDRRDGRIHFHLVGANITGEALRTENAVLVKVIDRRSRTDAVIAGIDSLRAG